MKWVIKRIVNLRVHLVMTTYPLGKPPHLPDYIKNNRYIIGLEKNTNHAYHYEDRLCSFRCLAIGKFGKTRHNCNRKAKELFQDYCNHFQVKPKTFEGVELDEFPELEKYFEVQLFEMFLKEDGSPNLPFSSLVPHQDLHECLRISFKLHQRHQNVLQAVHMQPLWKIIYKDVRQQTTSI